MFNVQISKSSKCTIDSTPSQIDYNICTKFYAMAMQLKFQAVVYLSSVISSSGAVLVEIFSFLYTGTVHTVLIYLNVLSCVWYDLFFSCKHTMLHIKEAVYLLHNNLLQDYNNNSVRYSHLPYH